jgi:signal peptidase I
LAALLGLLGLTIYLATDRLAIPWIVSGRSMEPTLMPGDIVLVDLWSYEHRRPRRGEVVLLYGPLPAEAPLVKRVAPAPPSGEAVPFDAGRWRLEGRPAQGAVWLLGDNPDISSDSRTFGPVPLGRIRGRLVWRYWPPGRMGPIRD